MNATVSSGRGSGRGGSPRVLLRGRDVEDDRQLDEPGEDRRRRADRARRPDAPGRRRRRSADRCGSRTLPSPRRAAGQRSLPPPRSLEDRHPEKARDHRGSGSACGANQKVDISRIRHPKTSTHTCCGNRDHRVGFCDASPRFGKRPCFRRDRRSRPSRGSPGRGADIAGRSRRQFPLPRPFANPGAPSPAKHEHVEERQPDLDDDERDDEDLDA